MRRVEGPRMQWIDDTGRHRYKWKQLDGSIGGREGGFMYPSVTETPATTALIPLKVMECGEHVQSEADIASNSTKAEGRVVSNNSHPAAHPFYLASTYDSFRYCVQCIPMLCKECRNVPPEESPWHHPHSLQNHHYNDTDA
ncbi:hypothetical protein HZ326_10336 [Fusarium oxysporum f. sp. albedinis]|nr:hypothetical protein HZ326_10336 [Fusarium oxysporum f. sp. albedinis]